LAEVARVLGHIVEF
jgi:hypothetical protein